MPTGRHLRRTLFVATVASTLIVTSAGPTLAATDHPVSISWSGVWNWLTDRHPTLAVPAQPTGTARGLPHEVPARTTRARRGTGRPPGKGRGQLPPFKLHGPTGRTTKTKPFSGNASRSFNPATSTPVMSRATATSTLYRNRDGSYSRLVYSAPVNYRSANGTWQPIKTALERTPSGRLRETSNPWGSASPQSPRAATWCPSASRRPSEPATASSAQPNHLPLCPVVRRPRVCRPRVRAVPVRRARVHLPLYRMVRGRRQALRSTATYSRTPTCGCPP